MLGCCLWHRKREISNRWTALSCISRFLVHRVPSALGFPLVLGLGKHYFDLPMLWPGFDVSPHRSIMWQVLFLSRCIFEGWSQRAWVDIHSGPRAQQGRESILQGEFLVVCLLFLSLHPSTDSWGEEEGPGRKWAWTSNAAVHVTRLPPLGSVTLGKWMLALSSFPVPHTPGWLLGLQFEHRKHVQVITFCSVSCFVRTGSHQWTCT